MPFPKFADYLSIEKNYSPHTLTAYLGDLEKFAEFASTEHGFASIENVGYPIIRSWIIALVNSGISNRTVNRKVSSLKTYYTFLLRSKQIAQNPLARHRALKTPKKIQVPFSENEINNVLALLTATNDFESVR
ncbi:MAG: site-specific integrase, partial [Marinirhabdus sp.]